MIFAIVNTAFNSSLYIILNDKLSGYRDYISVFCSSLASMLGKTDIVEVMAVTKLGKSCVGPLCKWLRKYCADGTGTVLFKRKRCSNCACFAQSVVATKWSTRCHAHLMRSPVLPCANNAHTSCAMRAMYAHIMSCAAHCPYQSGMALRILSAIQLCHAHIKQMSFASCKGHLCQAQAIYAMRRPHAQPALRQNPIRTYRQIYFA